MKLLNRVSVNEMDVANGKVVYTQWCNDKGGIEADLTATRISQNEYLVVTAAMTQLHDRRHLENAISDDDAVAVVDVTSGTSTIALMGPNSRALLQSLTPDDVSNSAFPFGTSREIEVGPARIRATRITYVGELGYELYIPSEFAVAVYDVIVAKGAAHGLKHAGYHAMNSLRIEKAYRHWSHDITPEDTPLEAGLGFCIAWNKQGGFIGLDALLRQKEQGITRRLAQFVIDDPDVMMYHDEPIWMNGKIISRLTSAMYGYTLGGAVGLGYVGTEYAAKPEDVLAGKYEIEVAGQRIQARVSLKPMYDPTSARIKA
jgi:4-methylaminobutanoate oxidase (formaldehyde-forming)